jgi:hypothetical protein
MLTKYCNHERTRIDTDKKNRPGEDYRFRSAALGLTRPCLSVVKIITFVLLSVWPTQPLSGAPAAAEFIQQKDDGYRGIWYMNQTMTNEYKYKYSGGMATYPQQHAPIAWYCKEVDKTFFCYGGTTARQASDKQELLHMVSYFDHKTKRVPRPTILLNKKTEDAHDNPTISVDAQGYIWIFSSSHGTSRLSYIHKSKKPYAIEEFELIDTTNFSYTQPWYIDGQGFLFLHTRYISGQRNLFWMTSVDGRKWNEPQKLAKIEMGDYQVSWRNGSRVATAFDFHPRPLGLNARANIYYLETSDLGKTWRTIDGKEATLPVSQTNNPALIYDSRAEGLLVYLKDLNFDEEQHPVILFLTSKGFEPGPENGPRYLKTARWTGQRWEILPLAETLNNYDHGSLYIEQGGTWRVIAAAARGPQPYNPGGEVAMWVSSNRGKTWKLAGQLTHDSERNQNYVRRPFNANPEFYAFWADGHGRQPSESSLYFTDQKGSHVWRLPSKMTMDFAKPEVVGEALKK